MCKRKMREAQGNENRGESDRSHEYVLGFGRGEEALTDDMRVHPTDRSLGPSGLNLAIWLISMQEIRQAVKKKKNNTFYSALPFCSTQFQQPKLGFALDSFFPTKTHLISTADPHTWKLERM